MVNSFFIGIVISVIISIQLFAIDDQETIMYLPNGAKAIRYLPASFKSYKRYPLLVVLHGMKQTMRDAFQKWKPVADQLNMILLCPQGSQFEEGYIRRPIDDRKNIVLFRDRLVQEYHINTRRTIVAGFSRGGNFAIELGVIYPHKFQNVICIFGFFNRGVDRILQRNVNRRLYYKSRFYFITGKNDLSYQSSLLGNKSLQRHRIKSNVWVYPSLSHSYPLELTQVLKRIRYWMFYGGSGRLQF